MCNRYVTPDEAEVERFWHIGARQPWKSGLVFPRGKGPFLRAKQDSRTIELLVGSFGLVPWFSKTREVKYATQNARFEELTDKASYKLAWERGQRALVLAQSFDEPCWETGRNLWWRFRSADGRPLALAGLWSTWNDKDSGELVDTFTMLTVNADNHPVMSRMHKPDPSLPPNKQDKRSVVPISPKQESVWLFGSKEEAGSLVRPPASEELLAGPV